MAEREALDDFKAGILLGDEEIGQVRPERSALCIDPRHHRPHPQPKQIIEAPIAFERLDGTTDPPERRKSLLIKSPTARQQTPIQ
jgi:hypothetical protein